MSAQLGFLVPGHPGTPQIRRDLQIRRDPGKQRAGREIHEFRRQPPRKLRHRQQQGPLMLSALCTQSSDLALYTGLRTGSLSAQNLCSLVCRDQVVKEHRLD